jgi:hypothetical protein
MPNFLPVLMYRPEHVFFLSTQQELACGIHLRSLIDKKGSKVHLFDDISAYDDTILNQRLNKIYTNYPDRLHLNVTGGTKPMAFAAYEFFRQRNKPVFYCNTENREIIHLYPSRKSEPIKANLTIEDYLAAYGYKIENEKPPDYGYGYAGLFSRIDTGNLFNEYFNFIAKIRKAFSTLSNRTIHSNRKHFSLQNASGNVIFTLNINDTKENFRFPDINFFTGQWLEYYVFWKLDQLYKPDELKIGVKILSGNNVRNEIDVLMLKDFILYLFSCKSGKVENQQLYEIETLRPIISGTYGRGVAVFTSEVIKPVVKRAQELKIHLVTDLKSFKIHEN